MGVTSKRLAITVNFLRNSGWYSLDRANLSLYIAYIILSVRAIRIMTIRFGKKTCNLRQLLATHKKKEREHTKKNIYNVRCDTICISYSTEIKYNGTRGGVEIVIQYEAQPSTVWSIETRHECHYIQYSLISVL